MGISPGVPAVCSSMNSKEIPSGNPLRELLGESKVEHLEESGIPEAQGKLPRVSAVDSSKNSCWGFL